MSPDIGGITGRLKLVVGDGEIDLGSVYLPLTVTRVSPAKAPYMHLGIGVDLADAHGPECDPEPYEMLPLDELLTAIGVQL